METKDLYTENCKMLLKKLNKTSINRHCVHELENLNCLDVSTRQSYLQIQCNPCQNPSEFFFWAEIENSILKFIPQ